VPTGSAAVARLAELPLNDALPRLVLPLLKVTVPVAVPPNCPATVAVKLTDCPSTEGFTDEVSAIEELACFTTWLTDVEALLVKFVSPL
jgi:hypothetical protein